MVRNFLTNGSVGCTRAPLRRVVCSVLWVGFKLYMDFEGVNASDLGRLASRFFSNALEPNKKSDPMRRALREDCGPFTRLRLHRADPRRRRPRPYGQKSAASVDSRRCADNVPSTDLNKSDVGCSCGQRIGREVQFQIVQEHEGWAGMEERTEAVVYS